MGVINGGQQIVPAENARHGRLERTRVKRGRAQVISHAESTSPHAQLQANAKVRVIDGGH